MNGFNQLEFLDYPIFSKKGLQTLRNLQTKKQTNVRCECTKLKSHNQFLNFIKKRYKNEGHWSTVVSHKQAKHKIKIERLNYFSPFFRHRIHMIWQGRSEQTIFVMFFHDCRFSSFLLLSQMQYKNDEKDEKPAICVLRSSAWATRGQRA